ncbi:hypothetical protein SAMN05428958_11617 [Pantoea sesami]|nr:hypothetical protein SAMN05428958_11617 [Pantoea sesami]
MCMLGRAVPDDSDEKLFTLTKFLALAFAGAFLLVR